MWYSRVQTMEDTKLLNEQTPKRGVPRPRKTRNEGNRYKRPGENLVERAKRFEVKKCEKISSPCVSRSTSVRIQKQMTPQFVCQSAWNHFFVNCRNNFASSLVYKLRYRILLQFVFKIIKLLLLLLFFLLNFYQFTIQLRAKHPDFSCYLNMVRSTSVVLICSF